MTMIPELDHYIELSRKIEHRQLPVLFIVGEELFYQIGNEKPEAHAGLANAGYQNRIHQGVPVIWNASITGRTVVEVEQSLLDALK